MKAVKLLFLLSIIFLSMQSAQCEVVYCVYAKGQNETDSSIFYTDQTDDYCIFLKEEYSQASYQRCIELNAKLRAAYRNGQCSPVVEKVHNFGSTTCNIQLNYKHKKILSKQCIGAEELKYLKKLDYMYPDFN